MEESSGQPKAGVRLHPIQSQLTLNSQAQRLHWCEGDEPAFMGLWRRGVVRRRRHRPDVLPRPNVKHCELGVRRWLGPGLVPEIAQGQGNGLLVFGLEYRCHVTALGMYYKIRSNPNPSFETALPSLTDHSKNLFDPKSRTV